MKDLKIGQIVRSKAGRDKTRHLAVVGFLPGRVLVADGRRHLLADPKTKNPAHLARTNTVLPAAALSNDQQLKRAMDDFEASIRPAGTEEDKKLV